MTRDDNLFFVVSSVARDRLSRFVVLSEAKDLHLEVLIMN
jgi:hypothetical protein